MNDDSMRLDDDCKLLDISEVAVMLNLHRHTVAKLLKQEAFPVPIINLPRKKMWSRSQIRRFVENGPNLSM